MECIGHQPFSQMTIEGKKDVYHMFDLAFLVAISLICITFTNWTEIPSLYIAFLLLYVFERISSIHIKRHQQKAINKTLLYRALNLL